MKFRFNIQHPKPKFIGIGYMDINENTKNLYAFDGDGRFFFTLEKSSLKWASKAGIMFSGFVFKSCAKDRSKNYIYQELFCGYIKGNSTMTDLEHETPQPKLQLRVGGYYKDGFGDIIEIKRFIAGDSYPWLDYNNDAYRDDGSNSTIRYNLIAECNADGSPIITEKPAAPEWRITKDTPVQTRSGLATIFRLISKPLSQSNGRKSNAQ